MTRSRAADTATLRGAAVGTLTAALAVAGHGVGGGGVPTSAGLTLVVLSCAVAGALAGALAGSRRGDRATLLATLAGGQLLGHLALTSVVGHEHGHAGPGGMAMVAAHASATLVCAALLLSAEKLYGPITRVLRVLVPRPTATVLGAVRRPPPRADHPLVLVLLGHILSRRGPPASSYV